MNSFLSFLEFFPSPMKPDNAKETVAYITNPEQFGSVSTKNAHTTILVNKAYGYWQPNAGPNVMANHIYAVILNRALCAAKVCNASASTLTSTSLNLNAVSQSLPNGTFEMNDYYYCYPICECDKLQSVSNVP